MAKTSPYTGTQKKAIKAESKTRKFLAEQAVKDIKHGEKYKKSAQHDIREIGKGKHGLTASLGDLVDKYKRAGKGAEKIFAPIREEAIANFDQYQTPEIANQYGRESGAGSSALNQAMAAARGNLQRGLAADFSTIQSNLASNLLGQSESNKLANLNARMQAHGASLGQPIQPVFGGHQNAYNQPMNRGPNGYQQAAGTLLKTGATILGDMFGGPPGAVAANKAASWGTNQMGLS